MQIHIVCANNAPIIKNHIHFRIRKSGELFKACSDVEHLSCCFDAKASKVMLLGVYSGFARGLFNIAWFEFKDILLL